MAFPPRKTIVAPTGATPFKTVARPAGSTPRKTIVGATARPPIKTVVGSTAAPPPKTLVGSTAAPPLKTTPANLGKGSRGALGPGFTERPNSASNPRISSRSLGNSDGNPGRSVAPMPPRASGPPNPVLDSTENTRTDKILAGGMGPTAKTMGRARRGTRAPRRPSMFYGG
jgi:hypothetical protein